MIRRMKPEDSEALIPLFRELWPDKPLDEGEIKDIFNQYLEDEMYDIYVFEEEMILGIITISKRKTFFYGGSVAIIEDLVVSKESRGKGIGRELVEFIEREFEEDIRALELSSDMHRNLAHEFWEKRGYSRSGYHFRKILGDG